MKVKVVEEFNDAELNVKRTLGEEIEVSEERAKTLLGNNTYNRAFVEVVETVAKPKRTKKKDNK